MFPLKLGLKSMFLNPSLVIILVNILAIAGANIAPAKIIVALLPP